MPSIELRRRIRWADADAAGRLYYPRMFDYFSEAESELLRSLGFTHYERKERFDFPRVRVECHFHRTLKLDATFTLKVEVGKLGRSSIRYEFKAFDDLEPDVLAAEGSVTVVVVQDGRPVEIPAPLRSALS